MPQWPLKPKNKIPRQKVVLSSRRTHTQTDTKVIQRTPFQGFINCSFNLSARIGPTKIRYMILKWIKWKMRAFVTFCGVGKSKTKSGILGLIKLSWTRLDQICLPSKSYTRIRKTVHSRSNNHAVDRIGYMLRALAASTGITTLTTYLHTHCTQ